MNPVRLSKSRRASRIAPAVAAALLLTACADGSGGGLPAADASDACRAQAAELDRSGQFFAVPIVAGGVAVVGAGGVLGTRPGVVGGLVWAATSAAAAVTAVAYLDQRRREAAGNEAALATAIGNDIDRENAGLAQTQAALDGVMDCRLREARRVQEAARAGAIQRQEAAAQLAAMRAQAERELAFSRTIEQRVQARAVDLDAGVAAVAPGAPPAPPPRPAVVVRPARPVPLQAAPVAAAAPAPTPTVAPRQEVRVLPARNPDFVAVETPAGQPLGYAPVAVFSIPAAQTRAIAMPALATGLDATAPGRVRTLASTNIVRRDNFREAVGDFQRVVSAGGFELGT
ncbi:hypothetical protein [Roseomonas sp. CECT 9278]|uniref:hypothetical protein n=1 Tax=Roseomonas sp. CECT 9278 TaxID=2845823 RepID=UPI001E4C6708|nr:hypothetical protein [Roseomonas sp. CECT 9278]CAH0295696.1 hypothetical protein ROS9278_04370 [Roseomonas sp. CECT 9278]